jgi:hypothetical protein
MKNPPIRALIADDGARAEIYPSMLKDDRDFEMIGRMQ